MDTSTFDHSFPNSSFLLDSRFHRQLFIFSCSLLPLSLPFHSQHLFLPRLDFDICCLII
ncbi:hypothetical protein Lalb_Chr18g0055941 [Lupinus albus]|uniref:Uncharacterized protein n=1 Tax=Lupinus albus TaxID=3870 RepID=A0A6A4P4Q7_LUPAL|nr:hypothetical protein Lalb_Chr18g0055941 [Lupinus albus]